MVVVWSLVTLVVGLAVGWALRGRRDASSASDVATLQDADTTEDDRASIPATLVEAVDRLDLAVVIGDDDGRIVYSNRAARSLGGTHTGVILEGHLLDALATALTDHRTERRIELHGPPRVTIDVTAHHLDGGGAVAVVEDVSESVRIDAMRTDFVANISHELKTPMGAIAVLADALDGEQDLSVIDRMSARIVTESHRAASTIDDLLELARIEASGADREVVDLAEVIERSLDRGRALDTGVEVQVVVPTPDVLLRGDRRQLTSAIGNLVENAMKFSESDGVVQVRIGVDDRFVEVTVTDRGPGIPERDLARVFERFYRVDRARSRDTGGTGLGLAIVRHVATNHGGTVSVSSQEGEGSTFVLRLPASLVIDDAGDVDLAERAKEAQ